jgi:hypothetical protein
MVRYKFVPTWKLFDVTILYPKVTINVDVLPEPVIYDASTAIIPLKNEGITLPQVNWVLDVCGRVGACFNCREVIFCGAVWEWCGPVMFLLIGQRSIKGVFSALY